MRERQGILVVECKEKVDIYQCDVDFIPKDVLDTLMESYTNQDLEEEDKELKGIKLFKK